MSWITRNFKRKNREVINRRTAEDIRQFHVVQATIAHTPVYHEGVVFKLEGQWHSVQRLKNGGVRLRDYDSFDAAVASIRSSGGRAVANDTQNFARWPQAMDEIRDWVDEQSDNYDLTGGRNCQDLVDAFRHRFG